MLKILHTSDWHLGANFETFSREADHREFFRWLKETIERESVDVLVVAGDIFDQAAPSAEAQRLYYGLLHDLADSPLSQVVVVGGNHDSAARLEAPRELLSHFRVHVVGGGISSDPASLLPCLCPIPGKSGGIDAMILAVPYVHEWRLGYRLDEGVDPAAPAPMNDCFRRLYFELANLGEAKSDGAPLVATGHLAATGGEKGDAPAEIHRVGTLGGLSPDIFDPRLFYVALGHIHRRYRVGRTRAFYSGSPIALTVKEGLTPRSVNLVTLGGEEPIVLRREISGTRRVLEIRGNLDDVRDQIASLEWNSNLPPLVTVFVETAAHAGLTQEILDFASALPRPVTVASVARFTPGSAVEEGASDRTRPCLADLTPTDVFRLLCESRQEDASELLPAFESLLEKEGQP